MNFKRQRISRKSNFKTKKISDQPAAHKNPANPKNPAIPEKPISHENTAKPLHSSENPTGHLSSEKPIPHPPKKQSVFSKHHSLLFPIITVIVGSLFLLTFLFGTYSLVKNLDFFSLITPFSQKVKTDENNHTNFLLLGTGTIMHEGSDLTDSIIVASLDHTHKFTGLISIPRDLYVETEYGNMRINQIYDTTKRKFDSAEGLAFTAQTVEKIVGIPIHYYAKINFDGFVELIDLVGGVDIYLENNFNDPHYPKGNTEGFEPFYLPAGLNHLDGEKALKYARSRHTTSDFSRSQRQQELLIKLKENALDTQVLTNPDRIKKIYFALSENFETNLSLREILYLAQISPQFSKQNLNHAGLHNEPELTGGFLYVPDSQYYNGAFVLIPQTCPNYGLSERENPYAEIQTYAHLVLGNAYLLQNKPTFQVLNGSGTPGFATKTKNYLTRYSFPILRFGNARSNDIQKTTYFIKTNSPETMTTNDYPPISDETLALLQELIPGEISTEIPEKYLAEPYLSDAQIVLEIGADFEEFYLENEEKFY